MLNLNISCIKNSQSPALQIHSEIGEPNCIISCSSITKITECSHCKLMPSYGIKRYNSVRHNNCNNISQGENPSISCLGSTGLLGEVGNKIYFKHKVNNCNSLKLKETRWVHYHYCYHFLVLKSQFSNLSSFI